MFVQTSNEGNTIKTIQHIATLTKNMKWVPTAHIFTWRVNIDFEVKNVKKNSMIITVVM